MDFYDESVNAKFQMGNHRDAPKMSTKGDGLPTTSTLALAFTFEPIRESFSPSSLYYSSSHKFNSNSIGFFTTLSKESRCN